MIITSEGLKTTLYTGIKLNHCFGLLYTGFQYNCTINYVSHQHFLDIYLPLNFQPTLQGINLV